MPDALKITRNPYPKWTFKIILCKKYFKHRKFQAKRVFCRLIIYRISRILFLTRKFLAIIFSSRTRLREIDYPRPSAHAPTVYTATGPLTLFPSNFYSRGQGMNSFSVFLFLSSFFANTRKRLGGAPFV